MEQSALPPCCFWLRQYSGIQMVERLDHACAGDHFTEHGARILATEIDILGRYAAEVRRGYPIGVVRTPLRMTGLYSICAFDTSPLDVSVRVRRLGSEVAAAEYMHRL